MEAVSGSNAPAVNWGTRLERPGSSPDLPPMEKAILSGGWHGSAQAVASLGHLIPGWKVEQVDLTRGATAEKNPTGDGQYCNIEVIDGYGATWRSRNEGYQEAQEKKQSLRVSSG